jgi:hypothetical protein
VPGETGPADRVPGVQVLDGASREHRRGNGFATAALALGVAGVTVVTIVPGVVFGILGLRRAAACGAGRMRSWLGIGLCLFWAAAASYLLPHLVRAADPGCAAYKGPALTAYNRVISDFNGSHATPHLAGDVSRAIGELEAAADRSRDPATARALSVLTRDLHTVLGELRTGAVVPGTAMHALNRDAARADAACGTLHV